LHDEKRLIFQQKSGFYPTDFSSFLVAIVWISGNKASKTDEKVQEISDQGQSEYSGIPSTANPQIDTSKTRNDTDLLWRASACPTALHEHR
jgi:hypothetical protein